MALVQFLAEVIHRDESWGIGWQRQGLFVWVTGYRELTKNVGIGRVSVYKILIVWGRGIDEVQVEKWVAIRRSFIVRVRAGFCFLL